MKFISNFRDLYLNDRLPHDLDKWFVPEEQDSLCFYGEDLRIKGNIYDHLQDLECEYRFCSTPRRSVGERQLILSHIPFMRSWKLIKQFATINRKIPRKDIHQLNKLLFSNLVTRPDLDDRSKDWLLCCSIKSVVTHMQSLKRFPEKKSKENIANQIKNHIDISNLILNH